MIIFGVIIYPLLRALYLSLFEYSLTKVSHPFIGLGNYAHILSTPAFWASIERTLYFTLVSTAAELVLGLLVALLLNQEFYGRGVLRALIIIPWALPTMVNGMMWRWIDNADYGALNALLTQLHLIPEYRPWLSTPMSAMNMVIIADVWKMTPLVTLLILASLQTIPRSLYESSSLDGAGRWRTFWSIVFPYLKPTILIVLVVRTMEAFKVFDIIFMMTRGGPANGTLTVAYYTYVEAFSNLQLGSGAALSYLIALFILGFAMIYVRLLQTGDN